MQGNTASRLPLWLKLLFSLYMVVLVPVYWVQHGPQNFLWGCDIALFCALLALWKEWSLPASMAILISLIPDIIWNLDFLMRFVGIDLLGIGATYYMFNQDILLPVRLLSLFHVFMLPMLLWIIYKLGYDRRALLWQTVLTVVVLPVSFLVSSTENNINFVHGFGDIAMPWPPGLAQVAVLMAGVPLVFYLPAHMLLLRYFSDRSHIVHS